MFKVLLLLAGVAFLLFQIFVNQGSKSKFKSDLPQNQKGGKLKCFSILFPGFLVLLFLILTILSLWL